jgi:hypothetical protein
VACVNLFVVVVGRLFPALSHNPPKNSVLTTFFAIRQQGS